MFVFTYLFGPNTVVVTINDKVRPPANVDKFKMLHSIGTTGVYIRSYKTIIYFLSIGF